MTKLDFGYVLNTKISTLSFNETLKSIEESIISKSSYYYAVCNTHSLVTSTLDEDFKRALINAELCVPDGMPLVWALRSLGFKGQERVDGPNLMIKLCKLAEIRCYNVFLYGGSTEKLDQLEKKLQEMFPNIKIVGKISPPFRKISEKELNEHREEINFSKADITFVSLGCPKQEKWMYENSSYIKGVKIGVGAAFEFITGEINRPPVLFQKLGLEWFFRLVSEPKRLWKRYLVNNTLFIIKYIINKNKDYKKTHMDSKIVKQKVNSHHSR